LTLISVLIVLSLILWIFRYHVVSLSYYLLVRFERRKIDFQLLGSLRDDLVHERKKKIAGLEMILSSWEKGEEVQPRYEYFEDLLGQLRNLVLEQRRNLMAVAKDILLWGKLWNKLKRIEKTSSEKREKSDIPKLRRDLTLFQNVIDEVVEDATKKLSFTLNEVVKGSVKIVRIEKSKPESIEIAEQLDDAGDTVRFSYDKFKEWQRVLTNLIRNAIEAVEAKRSEAGGLGLVGEERVAADFSLRGGDEHHWVKVSTRQPDAVSDSVSVIIEDSGIGMDEATKASFYKKGFTSGKEGGLGLGVSEESVQFINQYGNWQIESQKGVGTKITINIDREKAWKAELILPAPKPFFRTRLAFGLSLFLLTLIGSALLFAFHKYSRFWVDWNPAYAKVEQGRQIFLFNSGGKELWMHEFGRPVFVREESEKVSFPLLKIEDLDQDGLNETVVAIRSGVQFPGQLFCFDHKGHMAWGFSGGQGFENIIGITAKKPEIFEIRNFLMDDFIRDGKKEILVISTLSTSFPCQLTVLDHQGNVVGEYWHPGDIPFSIYTDIDGDKEKELICAGINNRLNWRPVVFSLDVKELVEKLQGPPYSTFGDLKPAKEKKYVVLPQIKEVVWDWDQASPQRTPELMEIRPNNIFLLLPDSRHYSLTRELRYSSCFPRIGKFNDWRRKVSFSFELDPQKDSLNWKDFEVYENGVRVK